MSFWSWPFQPNNIAVTEYIILGVDSIIAGMLFTLYKRREAVIRHITDAPKVNVGPELESILKQTSESMSISPYIAITGRVKELGQLIESSTGLKGVIERTTLMERSVQKYTSGHWFSLINTTVSQVGQTQKDVQFALQEVSSGPARCGDTEFASIFWNLVGYLIPATKSVASVGFKGTIVEVITPGVAETESLLMPISKTNFTPTFETAASRVLGIFTRVASKGIETSNELLPVDTIVTGIGTVSKDSFGNLRLAPPNELSDRSYPFYLTQLPVETLIKKLESRRDTIRFYSYVFLAFGLVIGSRRLFFLWKEYKMKKYVKEMREKVLKRRNEIDAQGVYDAQMCIVCLQNPREVILLDCGHVCICTDCVSKVNAKCPMCRNSFNNTHAAYLV